MQPHARLSQLQTHANPPPRISGHLTPVRLTDVGLCVVTGCMTDGRSVIQSVVAGGCGVVCTDGFGVVCLMVLALTRELGLTGVGVVCGGASFLKRRGNGRPWRSSRFEG